MLGENRIMDSLTRFFFLPKKILKFKKGWEKIGLWIPLNDFFSNKKILKFKKGWGKIGLWIPLFVFFSNKKNCFFLKTMVLYNLLNDFCSQTSKFENSKKARRR